MNPLALALAAALTAAEPSAFDQTAITPVIPVRQAADIQLAGYPYGGRYWGPPVRRYWGPPVHPHWGPRHPGFYRGYPGYRSFRPGPSFGIRGPGGGGFYFRF